MANGDWRTSGRSQGGYRTIPRALSGFDPSADWRTLGRSWGGYRASPSALSGFDPSASGSSANDPFASDPFGIYSFGVTTPRAPVGGVGRTQAEVAGLDYGPSYGVPAAEPGTYTYQPTTPQEYAGMADYGREQLGAIPTHHQKKKRWYRKVRSWAEFYRDVAQGALGTGEYDSPVDPLARLQQQLGAQYDPSQIAGAFGQNYNFQGMLGARQQALGTALQQRAAGMGIGGAFQGVMSGAQQARGTLAQQALAAYRPQAWQAQQHAQDQTQQLLNAMAQAEFEAQLKTETAGRGV